MKTTATPLVALAKSRSPNAFRPATPRMTSPPTRARCVRVVEVADQVEVRDTRPRRDIDRAVGSQQEPPAKHAAEQAEHRDGDRGQRGAQGEPSETLPGRRGDLHGSRDRRPLRWLPQFGPTSGSGGASRRSRCVVPLDRASQSPKPSASWSSLSSSGARCSTKPLQ